MKIETLKMRMWLVGSLFGTKVRIKSSGEIVETKLLSEQVASVLSNEFFRQETKLHGVNWSEDLAKQLVLELTRFWNGDPNPTQEGPLEDWLREKATRVAELLDEAFGLPFFQLDRNVPTAYPALLKILEEKIEDFEFEPHHHLIQTRSEGARDISERLSPGQRDACEKLNDYLADCTTTAVHWQIDVLSGPTFIGQCLPFLDNAAFETVHILRPVHKLPYNFAYNAALRSLARHYLKEMDILPDLADLVSDLPRKLAQSKAIAIFASANCLAKDPRNVISVPESSQDPSKMITPFCQGLATLSVEDGSSTVCLFLSSTKPYLKRRVPGKKADKMVEGFEAASKKLKTLELHELLRSSHNLSEDQAPETKTTFQVFSHFWDLFFGDEGEDEDVQTSFKYSNRLKVAYYWYSVHTDLRVWHRSAKMRAAAASNQELMAYTDACMGIERLLEAQLHQFDIVSDIQDVLDQMALVGETNLRTLRHISAAKFWARESSIEEVFRRFSQTGSANVIHSDLRKSEAGEGDALVRMVSDDGDRRGTHFRSPLDVKAIVMDHWRDQINRSKDKGGQNTEAERWRTLFKLAAVDLCYELDEEENVKELPVSVHIDAHLQILPEIFRKFIMSVEHVDIDASMQRLKAEDLDRMTLREAIVKGKCDHPKDVFRFCFKRIYLSEFGQGIATYRPLFSRDDRADTFAAEMLELVSEDRRVGEPHEWLDSDLHDEYYGSCATVFHAIGMVDKAKNALANIKHTPVLLDRAIKIDTCTEGQLANELTRLRAVAGLQMYSNEAPSFADLPGELESREAVFLTILQLTLGDDNHWKSVGPALKSFVGDGLLETTTDPRFSHRIGYLWDIPESIECKILLMRICARYHERLAMDENADHSEKQDHLTYAAAFLQRSIARVNEINHQNDRMRMMVALQRVLRQRAESLPPEEYKRRLFDIEGNLNDCLRRALNIGCAYDIYIELMIEATLTLTKAGRPIRAYCAYGRPVLEIITSIGYLGFFKPAMEAAEAALAAMRQLYDGNGPYKNEGGPHLWNNLIESAIKSQRRVENLYNAPIQRRMDGEAEDEPQPIDVADGTPVFGYLLPQVCGKIDKFRDFEDTHLKAADFLLRTRENVEQQPVGVTH